MNRVHLLACFTVFSLPLAAFAQQQPPMPPAQPNAPQPPHHEVRKEMRGGPGEGSMGILPPGTWWRDPHEIQDLTLTADQQKKLDAIFLDSRIGLIHLHASLEEEQLKLEPLLNANPVDQGKSLAEISKIADLRAELEKADARMLLSLRAVLTADQWTKMQSQQHNHHDGEEHGRPGGARGPQGGGQRGDQPGGRGNGLGAPGGPPIQDSNDQAH